MQWVRISLPIGNGRVLEPPRRRKHFVLAALWKGRDAGIGSAGYGSCQRSLLRRTDGGERRSGGLVVVCLFVWNIIIPEIPIRLVLVPFGGGELAVRG